MRKIVFSLLNIFIVFFAAPAQKKLQPITDSSNILQEVIVTATRKSTNSLSIPYSVNTVTKKEIEQFQFRTIPEALAGATGVFIQKTNHGGGSVFLRGLTGNQTLLMVDGIRFNNATFRFGPNQYLNTIDAYTVAKIEVARGTGSVQYGSDALGGVIQVFTKEPSFNTKKILQVAAIGKAVSADMEYTGRAELQYQSEKLAVLAGVTNRKFGDLIGGDTTGRQSPSGYKEQSFDVKLKWKLAENATLLLSHQFLQQNNVSLYHRVQSENFAYYFFAPQQRQITYARLEIDGRNKWLDKITFIGSLQKSLEKRTYQKNGNIYKFLEEDRVKTFGLTADIFSIISTNWTANSGIEYYQDKVNSSKQQITSASNATFNQRGLYPNNASNGNFSLYSLHHVKIMRFEIEAGLRYNRFVITIPDTITSTLKVGNVTVKPASLVANTTLLFHINQQQSVYTSFSTGYRSPNIDDMGTLGLVDFRYEIPAYNLRPETTYNSEVGYRYSNKKIRASVAVFYMQLTNLITRVPVVGEQVAGYQVYSKQNSQQSYIRGAEASFNYEFTKQLSINSGASYAYGQNTSRNEPMRRIPPFNGRLLLNYHKANWQAGLEQLFAGKQGRLAQGDKDDNRIAKGGTAGWNVINMYGGYVAHKYAVRIGFQNILNKDYRTHGSGINGMGRSAWMALQINL